MHAWRTAFACSLALSTLAATTALGQGKNKNDKSDECKIDLDKPAEVKSAVSSVVVASLGKPDDRARKLKSAVENLTLRPDKYSSNQVGRNFALGQALVAWSQVPGQAPVAKRGDLGYWDNKDQTIDILAAADSAFTAVEAANPCYSEQTATYRQQAWAPMINGVGPLLNADKLDSASALLKRSEVIYRASPYTYYFEGQIAQRKKDWTAASAAYAKAAELAKAPSLATDTTVASVREFSEFSAAYSALRAADSMPDAQKKTQLGKAAELYRTYLKDYPNGPNAQPAQAGLTAALKASGDTTSLASLWQDMVATPSKYTDLQLYDAATQAFSANQLPTAVKLMDAAQQANGWLRAGLYNAANVYWKANQFDKMLPVSQRLLSIDPDNPDNYQLVGIAYQGLSKATKDQKVAKAYSDSLNAVLTKGEKIPVKVSFSEFTNAGTKHTLAGTVENLGAAPKNVTLKVDFLDKQGAVVGSQSATVSVGPKEKKTFSMEADGATIAAFRYAPIS